MPVIYGEAIRRRVPVNTRIIDRPRGRNVRKRLEAILKTEFNAGRVVIKRNGSHWHVHTNRRLSEAEVLQAVAASSGARRARITHHSK